MREHIVKGVHMLKVYTNITLLLTWRLQSWHKGDCTASAHHHSLWQTAQCESHPVSGAQAVAASLRDCPLTWRRNTQIQMYWLRKWLESYNNCTFSTWKDMLFFNLLLWIPNLFCKFHDYARGGTPFLASPDRPSLMFYHSDIWTTFLLCKTALPWNFSLRWIICCLSGPLSNWWLALKNRVLNSLYWTYIILIIQNFEQLAHALKNRVCPKIFHCNEIFLSFRIFEEHVLPWKQSLSWNFSLYLMYVLHSGCLSNLCLPWKTEFALKIFTAWKYFWSFRIFEQLELALKTEFALKIFKPRGRLPPASYATGD